MTPVNPPTCRYCGKKLVGQYTRKEIKVIGRDGGYYHKASPEKTLIGYGYRGHGFFCSLTCGYQYGLVRAKLKSEALNNKMSKQRKEQ